MPDWTPEQVADYRALRDLLRDGACVAAARSRPDTFALAAPVGEGDLLRAEHQLGMVLPDGLRRLYSQTDGLRVRHCWLIMPLAEMISENRQLRTEEDYRSLYITAPPLG